MGDVNKQQQSSVAPQTQQQQQSSTQQHPQMQQTQVESQTVPVQMSQDGGDQMSGPQVNTSNPTLNSSTSMVMGTPQQTLLQQQAMQNLPNPPALTPIPPSQTGSAAITTMSTGPPQQMAEWPGHGRVQVIQQPIQNPTYIQPVYNTQGQLMVPGNIALHPGSMNQPIQVIAAGKAFQPGQMPVLTTAQGKQIVQGQATSFSGYTTIPTSGNNQTLVISQLGVLGQTNLLPQQGKPQDMQKMMSKSNISGSNMNTTPNKQNVSIASLVSSQPQGLTSQPQTIIQPQILSPIQYTCNTQQQRSVPPNPAQTMQFTPWQAAFGPAGLPQGLTWAPGAIQSSALLTQGNQIFIRNPQPDQTGMFIQNTQPSVIPQHNQLVGQQMSKTTQGPDLGGNVQPKTAVPKAFSTILPNPLGPTQLRPASSVSTQTSQTQAAIQQGSFQSLKTGAKVRTKNVCKMPSTTTSPKSDTSSPNKSSASVQVLQPKLLVSNAQAGTGVSQDKIIKPNQSPNPSVQVQQQPLGQIQIQNVFEEPVDPKSHDQVVVANGIQNGGERSVMPVVPMPPGQITSVMGNMILQTVPGIATMASGISIPPGQPNISIAQEIVGMPGTVALSSSIKQEIVDVKNHENGATETGPGRPNEENISDLKEFTEGDVPKNGKDGSQVELDDSSQEKETLIDDSDKKNDTLGQTKATMMVKPQVLTHVIEGFVIQESSEPFPVNRSATGGLIKKISMNENIQNGEPPTKKPMIEVERVEDDANKINPMKWTVAEVCEFIRNLPGCSEYVDDFAMQDIDGEALMLLKADHLMSAMSMKLGPAVKIIAKIDTMRVNSAPKETP